MRFSIKVNKEKLLFLLTATVLLSIYLYHFEDVPFFRMDDGWLLQAPRTLAEHHKLAASMLENGWNQTNYWHQHPPFYYVCLAFFFKVFGFGIIQARAFSLLLAVGCGFVFLKILRFLNLDRKINKTFTLLLLFTTPLFFILAKSTRPEMLFLLLSLISFYLLLCWESNPKILFLIMGALVTALLCLTHCYALYILLLWTYVLMKKRRLVDILFFCMISGIVFLPYVIWISSDFKAFEKQVLMARRLTSFDISTKVSDILRIIFLSRQTISVVVTLIIGTVVQLYYWKQIRGFVHKSILLIPFLFFAQFLVLPRINYLYVIAIVPFTYILLLWVVDQSNRKYILTVLSLVMLFNIGGISLYMYEHRNYNYQAYREQFIKVVPFSAKTKILGRASLYPIFSDAEFKAYEAYELSPDWRERLKNEIKDSDYVIVDEFSKKYKCGSVILDNDLLDYIHAKMKLFTMFTSKFYGSEGIKNNNLVEVYSKKNI